SPTAPEIARRGARRARHDRNVVAPAAGLHALATRVGASTAGASSPIRRKSAPHGQACRRGNSVSLPGQRLPLLRLVGLRSGLATRPLRGIVAVEFILQSTGPAHELAEGEFDALERRVQLP